MYRDIENLNIVESENGDFSIEESVFSKKKKSKQTWGFLILGITLIMCGVLLADDVSFILYILASVFVLISANGLMANQGKFYFKIIKDLEMLEVTNSTPVVKSIELKEILVIRIKEIITKRDSLNITEPIVTPVLEILTKKKEAVHILTLPPYSHIAKGFTPDEKEISEQKNRSLIEIVAVHLRTKVGEKVFEKK
jgi:hypothetical protein